MTRPADAAIAAELGVDAIGVVFCPQAARGVPLDLARQIVAATPPFVTLVGLFVDQPIDEIRHVAAELKLSHLQLHGRESPESVAALDGFCVIKSVPVHRQTLESDLQPWHDVPNLQAILLETPTSQHGGSGIANDWAAIADAQAAGLFAKLPPLILAGGLNPHNVGDVIRPLRPWAVDVSSGIESGKGIKSVEKMRAFAAAVRRADGES